MFERIAFYGTLAVIGLAIESVMPGVGIVFAASAIVARHIS
jgi:hypothetical protein